MKIKNRLLTISVLIAAGAASITLVNAAETMTKNNGVVTDSASGLQWQDNYDNNNGQVKTGSFEEATPYCASLSLNGHQDWRMPSQAELLGIVDKSREPHDEPLINKAFEHVLTEEAYLSTTHYEDDDETVWIVDYTYGDSTDVALTMTDGYYIRCVRSL